MMELYIISESKTGPIKIGRSRNSESRATALQTGNPRMLLVALAWQMDDSEAIEAERFLHEELEDFHLIGEWFSLSEDFIEDYMPDFFAANGFEAKRI